MPTETITHSHRCIASASVSLSQKIHVKREAPFEDRCTAYFGHPPSIISSFPTDQHVERYSFASKYYLWWFNGPIHL